jgi:hypothetical protein
MDRNQEYQKQRKARETFKKIVINVFIWALIIAFVSTIGVTWNSNRRSADIFKVVQVNGRLYDNRPGATFNYIYSATRDQISRNDKVDMDSRELEKVSVERAADILQNYAMLLDFAQKNGVKPSQEMLRGVIEALTGRATSVPTKGLIDYATMEYVNASLTGNQGDLLSAFGPVTLPELYSYFDLVNFTVGADVAYIDVTNFIQSRIADAELQSFYQSNISHFAGEVKVDELSVSNKTFAYQVAAFAGSNGWDKTLEAYRSNTVYTNNLVLRGESGLSKRYVAVLTNVAGSVLKKPQFENGVYHIIRVDSFPDLNNLGATYKTNVLMEYVLKNYSNLSARFSPQLEATVTKAAALAASNSDLQTVAASTGMRFVKTAKTSPINQMLRDEKGDKLPLPILNEDSWFDAMFSTPVNHVSGVLRTSSFIAILKPVYKGANPNIDYEKIDQDVAMRWINFKNFTTSQDWAENLRESTRVVTYGDDIKKIEQLMLRD